MRFAMRLTLIPVYLEPREHALLVHIQKLPTKAPSLGLCTGERITCDMKAAGGCSAAPCKNHRGRRGRHSRLVNPACRQDLAKMLQCGHFYQNWITCPL